ncbi:MAG: cytochrome c oxidase subunit II [Bacteroidetes bacterium]|nr:cytochrome c oxidase subunit II [Bacteroidota bacterium]
MWNFPLLPDQASTFAGRVDGLYFFLVALTAFFTVMISLMVAFMAIRYRESNTKVNRDNPLPENPTMEAVWIGVPLVIVLVIFFWGVNIYFAIARPPANAVDMYVTGKQWMWKIQHPTGQREINEIHVAVGQPVRLTMISQDVIHSFYVPAFRVKQDVLPGRYSQLWFEPTKPGIYHLFCAEFCGTKHSGMIGRVVVMESADYERWLAGGSSNGGSLGQTMADAGAQIFEAQGCITCHKMDDASRAPILKGLYGKSVALNGGETVIADEQYIRESILRSGAKIVAGYGPIMPVYQNRISEDELMQLVSYIKSLGGPATGTPAATPSAAPASETKGTPAAAKPAQNVNEPSRNK